ncbi:hypothetical protein TWF730_000953 [Orbilia blumenaviensis]|uniref:Tetratricopeptide repeat domain-containing protein n=1 Tax=Orbilia blumenaviensis TaxID=1796055 RepID=A0AAV9VR80_9PEZI
MQPRLLSLSTPLLPRQSFARNFVNGYAQSAVAAAQSSYATTTSFPLSRLGQNTPSKIQAVFGGPNGGNRSKFSRGNDHLGGHHHSIFNKDGDRSLKYPERLQPTHASISLQLQQELEKKDVGPPSPELKPRASSMSTVRDYPTLEEPDKLSLDSLEVAVEDDLPSAGTAKVAAVAENKLEKVSEVAEATAEEAAKASSSSAINATKDSAAAAAAAGTTTTAAATGEVAETASETSDLTVVNSSSTTSTYVVRDYIQLFDNMKLAEQYDQIPLAFREMVDNGIVPTTDAYNYLLHAFTQIPLMGHERISRVMNIYAEMMERKMVPSHYTYSIVIGTLADQAARVQEHAKEADVKVKRFGFSLSSPAQAYDSMSDKHFALATDIYGTAATLKHRMTPESLNMLLQASAQKDRSDMFAPILAKMEELSMQPTIPSYREMIRSFGRAKDLYSAIDTYNVATDAKSSFGGLTNASKQKMVDSLVYAYFSSGEVSEGLVYVQRLLEHGTETTALCISVVKSYLSIRNYDAAVEWTTGLNASEPKEAAVLNQVCTEAADAGNAEAAKVIYEKLSKAQSALSAAAYSSLVAMSLRNKDLDAAEKYFREAESQPNFLISETGLHLATMFAITGAEAGKLDYGMDVYRRIVERFHATAPPLKGQAMTSIHVIFDSLNSLDLLTQRQSLNLLHLINHLGMPIPDVAVARRLLKSFEGVPMDSLSPADFHLLVIPQAVVSLHPEASKKDAQKIFSMAQLAHQFQLPLWNFPAHVVDSVQEYAMPPPPPPTQAQEMPYPTPVSAGAEHGAAAFPWSAQSNELAGPSPITQHDPFDEIDPHQATLDLEGSNAFMARLEGRTSPPLRATEIVNRFNLLKGHRHYQPQVIARAIGSIARQEGYGEKRLTACVNIFNQALKDMPLLKEYRKARYGWYLMYDAMIAACLHLERLDLARKYHQEMLEFGASPSANTYGLYIVQLKGSHGNFDEASEAIKIFEQAKSEGIAPTSFLYNALIGKLSKARRIDDCLSYFSEMRANNIKPTSVTYGTIVNALCRVSDERFAEELFAEMEAMPNYKPRPAPYNSMIQFFVHTKHNRTKALYYYERMRSLNIAPTSFTYKLLIEAHVTCDPPDLKSGEDIIRQMRAERVPVEAQHHAAIIHAKGCVLGDVAGARESFDKALRDPSVKADTTIFQAYIESLVANHRVRETPEIVALMQAKRIQMTPYIANPLIHGWALEGEIEKSRSLYDSLYPDTTRGHSANKREPSTYEAMTRAFLAVNDHDSAMGVVNEMASRSYPPPVMTRITGGSTVVVNSVWGRDWDSVMAQSKGNKNKGSCGGSGGSGGGARQYWRRQRGRGAARNEPLPPRRRREEEVMGRLERIGEMRRRVVVEQGREVEVEVEVADGHARRVGAVGAVGAGGAGDGFGGEEDGYSLLVADGHARLGGLEEGEDVVVFVPRGRRRVRGLNPLARVFVPGGLGWGVREVMGEVDGGARLTEEEARSWCRQADPLHARHSSIPPPSSPSSPPSSPSSSSLLSNFFLFCFFHHHYGALRLTNVAPTAAF